MPEFEEHHKISAEKKCLSPDSSGILFLPSSGRKRYSGWPETAPDCIEYDLNSEKATAKKASDFSEALITNPKRTICELMEAGFKNNCWLYGWYLFVF